MKADFPIFNRENLVYLDNAATSQKPQAVLDVLQDFYQNHNANIHRGIHTLSEEATEMYENARRITADFIGARTSEEVVFTQGTTHSLNMVAFGYAQNVLKKDDVILLTEAEHHSNLIPWQVVAQKTGTRLEFIRINEDGNLDEDDISAKITSKVKIIAMAHSSNILGSIFPVKRISELAHQVGAVVVVDGAQAVPHLPVNVQSLGCDFYAFSGHKALGPMGIGVLWARKEVLEKMQPFEYGGGMIDIVEWNSATYIKSPEKFEAGTPNAAGAIALGVALTYLKNFGMEKVREHELELNKYALEKLSQIDGLHILGSKDYANRTGLVSFTLDNIHSHDVAAVLNTLGVAVRSGHHCNMPLHKKLGISSSTRASWYIYNTKEDIDLLIQGILKSKELLK